MERVILKKIEDTVDKPYYDRMHARLQTTYAKRMKKIRSSTVEPVLGTLSNFLSMRRVNTRGLKSAGKCMLMAAVAYNLKKLLKFTAPKVLVNTEGRHCESFLSALCASMFVITCEAVSTDTCAW